MIHNVYRVDGKYPDPHDLLRRVKNAPDGRERDLILSAIRSAGLASHPLLLPLFVES
jgi:hypothetical protein